MPPFAKIDQEDIESGPLPLSIHVRPRGVDLGLQTLAVGNDQFDVHRFAATFATLHGRATSGGVFTVGARRSIELPGFEVFLAFGHGEARIERDEGGNQGKTDLKTPDGVKLAVMVFLGESLGEAGEEDECDY